MCARSISKCNCCIANILPSRVKSNWSVINLTRVGPVRTRRGQSAFNHCLLLTSRLLTDKFAADDAACSAISTSSCRICRVRLANFITKKMNPQSVDALSDYGGNAAQRDFNASIDLDIYYKITSGCSGF